jgi:hypothetical protein
MVVYATFVPIEKPQVRESDETPAPHLRGESNDEISLYDECITSIDQIRDIERELMERHAKEHLADLVLLAMPQLMRVEEFNGLEWVVVAEPTYPPRTALPDSRRARYRNLLIRVFERRYGQRN